MLPLRWSYNIDAKRMDRKIPLEEKRKAMVRRGMRISAVVLMVVLVLWAVMQMMADSVDMKDVEVSVVDVGDLQVSVTASGNVVPEHQEIIVSPINTRIVEVYRKTGDELEEGTPLLRLDLQTAETDYKKGLDDEQMRRLQLEKLRITQHTRLTDLKMRIEVAQMALNSKRMQLRNEQYLDSIGSGTTDRVRQAQLDYNTAQLELEQLNVQYANEVKAAEAEYKVQELDLQMFGKSLAEIKRTLEDARILSPRKAVLTYINNNIGAQISQGEQVAIVSDLSSFKAECAIADGYIDRMAVGGRVLVRWGKEQLAGSISSFNPQTKNGMLEFNVRFDEPSHKLLRSGLKVEIYVLTSEKPDVLRIKNGRFYQGAGKYKIYVVDGDRLTIREVTLGEASYDYIEVKSGLREGEQVVVSDMDSFKGKNNIKIKSKLK